MNFGNSPPLRNTCTGELNPGDVDVETGVLRSMVALCLLTFLAHHLVAIAAHSALNIAGEKTMI